MLAILAGLLWLVFHHAIVNMAEAWTVAESSHGFLIPIISAFLIWQRKAELRQVKFNGSWAGVGVVLVGIGFDLFGRLGALYFLEHAALLIVIAGLVLSLTGWQGFRLLAVPLGVLVFMIPLPNLWLNPLSSELQLISSSIGVWLMRASGVAVFLEGNVIDLGSYKLEVAEACSGLRYLFPLMTLAFLMACFYRETIWKRLLVFLSSIPITIIMNSLRIAAIGIMVDRWGIGMAEGLLHEVQGWMVFMLSTGMLLLEIVVLTRLGKARNTLQSAFSVNLPPPVPTSVARRHRLLPASLFASGALMLLYGVAVTAVPRPLPASPQREMFVNFPLQLADWSGRRLVMDQIYIDALKFDDYFLADYAKSDSASVNFYVAWYDSQSAGEATHSPRACLPSGGWRIIELKRAKIDQVSIGSQPLQVNRALIELGDRQQLVYYWFQQRGRIVTSEYLVKWYLLVDSVFRHRTDGALVRLIVPISGGTTIADADRELQDFAATVALPLTKFIPG